jgi:hypothetical protein
MMFARSAPTNPAVICRDRLQIGGRFDRDLARVQLQDLEARRLVGAIDRGRGDRSGPARSSAWSRISGRFGRGHQDDADARIEAVQLDEQLVQRLLALFVRDRAHAARLAQRVQLVDEDDARGLLLGLLEQIAHARGAHAHEHLDEVGAADRKRTERRPRPRWRAPAASCRFPGGPTSSTPFGQLGAQPSEPRRRLQEVDHLQAARLSPRRRRPRRRNAR